MKVEIRLPEKGIKGAVKRILGRRGWRSSTVELVKIDEGYYTAKHGHEVPLVDSPYPHLKEVPAYGASIAIGGVGGAVMSFVYKKKDFRREVIQLARKYGANVFEDPEGVIKIWMPPSLREEDQRNFLELYGKLVELWHKYH